MSTLVAPRSGGLLLVDQLVAHGVDVAFGVPGESYLPVLDALYERRERIRFVVARQEGGAAFMAEAYAKTTGGVGVCFATRGPGASNAAIGVHTAQQDSTPLILFVGQVGSDCVERDAFQEIDYRRMFGSIAKWVAQIDRADRVPEMIAHAFHVAQQGRMGPVVLALPEDMLAATATVDDAAVSPIAHAAPTAHAIAQVRECVARARAPMLVVGGSGWSREACADVRRFAHRHKWPVACAFRRQDIVDNDDPCYAGDVGLGIHPKLAARIRDADVVIALGTRLGEATTSGYSLFDVPNPRQTLVHIHPGADELGRVYARMLPIQAHVIEGARMLAHLEFERDASVTDAVAAHLRAARADLAGWQAEPAAVQGVALNPWRVVRDVQRVAGRDALIANGAGNFATWAHRFWKYRGIESVGRAQLAPTSGAMGYGLPAGIAAKLADPARTVIVFTGDGDFLMTGQELATAVHERAGVVVLVFDNGMYGTIRMHQERSYPGRPLGTALTNPDFAALARAYGAHGVQVERTDDFAEAFETALTFTRERALPAVIALRLDPTLITPQTRLSTPATAP